MPPAAVVTAPCRRLENNLIELPEKPSGLPEPAPKKEGWGGALKRLVLGKPRDLKDPQVFHKLALVAFLAWVGLGADGLSSSSYGPDEAFRAILGHEYLAIFLALLTAITVLMLSISYSHVVEHFPSGGGGYLVATKLLGPTAGVVSGSALVVDYVLTITVSICSGVEAILSFMPLSAQPYRLPVELAALFVLLLLNLRGVKESIKTLLPIFLVFLATHLLLITYGIFAHVGRLPQIASETHRQLSSDLGTLGWWALLMIFLRAYSLGGGTYTGIEAVSNGIQILKEPRVATAKRTMLYMAGSLIFTAGGILACYLLWQAAPQEGKTMNAVLLERVFGSWQAGGWQVGVWLVVVTLVSEGALLFVAAQAGFIDGPRVLANMAMDSFAPHRFANLSERLVARNGIVLMAVAAALVMIYTKGQVFLLVVLYSINVFLTFSLTQLGMSRFWVRERHLQPGWWKNLALHGATFMLCAVILVVTTLEKFKEGGWLTLVITASFITICLLIKRHYEGVRAEIGQLDTILTQIPSSAPLAAEAEPIDRNQPVAALLVSGYGGLGIHSLLNIMRLFPGYYKNVLFLSVGAVDSGAFKGHGELERLEKSTEENLKRYVDLARNMGLRAEYRYRIGTDVLQEAESLCGEIGREFPKAVFFLGKLVFAKEKFYYRLLHNDTAFAIQKRLQFSGLMTVILPIRMRI
jgi:amino acid transporter